MPAQQLLEHRLLAVPASVAKLVSATFPDLPLEIFIQTLCRLKQETASAKTNAAKKLRQDSGKKEEVWTGNSEGGNYDK